MLGNYTFDDDHVIFEPLIPFTRGLRYEILVNGVIAGKVDIPEADATDSPLLLNIYPTQDTVPENLLKIYLHFSKPMREGVSAQHITVIKNNTDTLQGTFLDLQPELWNEDRTMLTLWLDPGRIKRDLIPNKISGTPLQNGNHYTLIIADRWTDTQGLSLTKPFKKEFTAATRDSESPDPKSWTLNKPVSPTDPLVVIFNSPLDYSLMMSTLLVHDGNTSIAGRWEPGAKEKSIKFIPGENWIAGNYTLRIETRLEDLAGNNINRLFDRTIKHAGDTVSAVEIISIPFTVTPQ